MSSKQEEYHGYPLEDRELEDTGEMPKPENSRPSPLKHIGGAKPRPKPAQPNAPKKF